MAAKKMPAKKSAAPKKPPAPTPPAPKVPTPKNKQPMGLAQSVYDKAKVNKKSQAGDLGEERAVMRKVNQYNDKARKGYEKYGFGTVAITYRDKNNKLQMGVVNRKRRTK